jgi:hypothetical protein
LELAGPCQNNGCHDPTTPELSRKPVPDLGTIRLADLEAVETAAADQIVIGAANGKMNGLAWSDTEPRPF